MKEERSIKIAFDKKSGKRLFADEIFDDRLIGFDYRAKYNRNEIEPYCVECFEKLTIPSSKYQNIHFRHYKTDTYCIFKEHLTPKEKDIFTQISYAKESERHIFLKNEIGKKLSFVKEVSNIKIDNHFISDETEKRKPDIYFEYKNKKIVFEIQLSNLSQKYILSRYDFYKRNGIFLVWLLNDLTVLDNTSQMEKDIKYISNHQNYFKFDENSETFNLICKFKSTHLSTQNQYYDEWKTVYIDLEKLNFDFENTEIFFYNFGEEKKQKIILQNQYIEKEKEEERKNSENIRLEKVKSKVSSLILKIKSKKKSIFPYFKDVVDELNMFSEEETQMLNEKLNFDYNNAIIKYLKIAKDQEYSFIDFLVTTPQFTFNINLKDVSGNTILDILFTNANFKNKIPLFKKIIARGYIIRKEDEKYLYNYFSYKPSDAEWHILIAELSKKVSDSKTIDLMFELDNMGVIRAIESAKRGILIGFAYKPNEWIKFANNVLEYYSKYWEYIEIAFKEFGLYDKLIELDKKGTFKNKLYHYYSGKKETDYNFEIIFKALYPEL